MHWMEYIGERIRQLTHFKTINLTLFVGFFNLWSLYLIFLWIGMCNIIVNSWCVAISIVHWTCWKLDKWIIIIITPITICLMSDCTWCKAFSGSGEYIHWIHWIWQNRSQVVKNNGSSEYIYWILCIYSLAPLKLIYIRWIQWIYSVDRSNILVGSIKYDTNEAKWCTTVMDPVNIFTGYIEYRSILMDPLNIGLFWWILWNSYWLPKYGPSVKL